MPKLTIEGEGIETRTIDVAEGRRLVLALKDAGVNQLHLCGGNAKCTTCKVEFTAGEPRKIAAAEKDLLEKRSLEGVRLSCQIACNTDMGVRIISQLEGSGKANCGSQPADEIAPEPEWIDL